MVARDPSQNRWLFGPVLDLSLGCGLLYAIVFGGFAAFPGIRSHQPEYLLPLLILLFSMPHYGGTLLRVYEQRYDRRNYAIFSVYLTIAIFALFVVSLFDTWIASLLVTVYISWAPWHYTGQNYGISMMFLGRRGVEVDASLKHWIYASFFLAFALTFLVMHITLVPGYTPYAYDAPKVAFLPLGIPTGIGNVLVVATGAAYLIATSVAAWVLLRRASLRDVAPVGALVLTQALWFSAPFSVRYFGWHTGLAPLDQHAAIRDFTLWTFVAHGVQYLWVTTYYARSAQPWSGYSRYLAKALVAGIAIWSLPVVLFAIDGIGRLSFDGGMALVVAAGVNLHHFVLDGAIWKLRNTRVASILIRSEPELPEGIGARTARRWPRRTVWTVALAGALIGFFEYYEAQVALPDAQSKGNLVRVRGVLDRLGWIGFDRESDRADLASRFLERGDLDAAAEQYERSLELGAQGHTWLKLAMVEDRRGDFDAATRAYESALSSGIKRPAFARAGLGRMAWRRGDWEGAIAQYREAVKIRPDAKIYVGRLARILASCPDVHLRDADEAIALLGTLDPSVLSSDADLLDALSISYAAADRFDDAIRVSTQAIELADGLGFVSKRREIEARRALYLDDQAYTETEQRPRG